MVCGTEAFKLSGAVGKVGMLDSLEKLEAFGLVIVEHFSLAYFAVGAFDCQPVATCVVYDLHGLLTASLVAATDEKRRHITVVVIVVKPDLLSI